MSVAGLKDPLVCTGQHPFWSEDRQDYVSAAHFRPGERVRTLKGGTAPVLAVEMQPGAAAVYNLEVHGEHVYHVSELGLLVHNVCERAINEGLGEQLTRNMQLRDILAAELPRLRTGVDAKNYPAAAARVRVEGEAAPRVVAKVIGEDSGGSRTHPEIQIVDEVAAIRGANPGKRVWIEDMISEMSPYSGCKKALRTEESHAHYQGHEIQVVWIEKSGRGSTKTVPLLKAFWRALGLPGYG